MSQLISLRKKIRSIQTTKKITHAVRLTSMAQYNKIEKMNAPWAMYARYIKEMFTQLLTGTQSQINQEKFPFLSSGKPDVRPLYIIIATSRGLCGGLNTQLFSFFNEYFPSREKRDQGYFIAIGQRAITFLKRHEVSNVVHSYAQLNATDAFPLAEELLSKIMDEASAYTSVTIFASEAKSFFIQKPRLISIMPLNLDATSSLKKEVEQSVETAFVEQTFGSNSEFLWEQNKDEVLFHLGCQYLKNSVVSILLQAMRAEHAARFLAMENSTNNAEKILERMTLQFNRQRQALITKEVSELSAGLLKH